MVMSQCPTDPSKGKVHKYHATFVFPCHDDPVQPSFINGN